MSVGVQMEGLDQIATTITTTLLKLGLPSGSVAIVTGGRRGPAKNALIAQVQAARSRNPWFIGADEMTAIRTLLHELIRQQAAFGLSRGLAAPRFLKDVGDLMVKSVRQNILQQKNKDGSTFAELSARYAAFKRRKYGFIHPVLVASRDLIDGLRAVVTPDVDNTKGLRR